jgi:hypothetical protein
MICCQESSIGLTTAAYAFGRARENVRRLFHAITKAARIACYTWAMVNERGPVAARGAYPAVCSD